MAACFALHSGLEEKFRLIYLVVPSLLCNVGAADETEKVDDVLGCARHLPQIKPRDQLGPSKRALRANMSPDLTIASRQVGRLVLDMVN